VIKKELDIEIEDTTEIIIGEAAETELNEIALATFLEETSS